MACNSIGQPNFTVKFLVARANNLKIVNAAILKDWEKSGKLPRFENYPVCLPELYSTMAKPQPLPSLSVPKIFEKLCFRLKDDCEPTMLKRSELELAVELLGGIFWEKEVLMLKGKMTTRTCFNIGEEFEVGKKVISSEWIVDMIVWGKKLDPKVYLVKGGSKIDETDLEFTQPMKKAKVR